MGYGMLSLWWYFLLQSLPNYRWALVLRWVRCMYTAEQLARYTAGGEGLITWGAENVCFLNKRKSRWQPWEPIDMEREFFTEALQMKDNGAFVKTTIVACRPRGDLKSFDISVMVLWRFYCFYLQTIVLAANSKEQVRFNILEECRDIILHSPNLKQELYGQPPDSNKIFVRKANKTRVVSGIRMRDCISDKGIFTFGLDGSIASQILPISGHTGLLSNINVAVFNEAFRMRDETFYGELITSIRNVPNAQIYIDTTVAPKGHFVHRLYEQAISNLPPPSLYFQYYGDHWYHPEMQGEPGEEQRSRFKTELTLNDYNRLIRNLWEAATTNWFTKNQIQETTIMGLTDKLQMGENIIHQEINRRLAHIETLKIQRNDLVKEGQNTGAITTAINDYLNTFILVDTLYRLPVVSAAALDKLCRHYNAVVWLMAGIDRAGEYPLVGTPKGLRARTAISLIAKLFCLDGRILYFALDISVLGTTEEKTIRKQIEEKLLFYHQEFDGLDGVIVEAWQAEDLKNWCKDRQLGEVYSVHPGPVNLNKAFSYIHRITEQGIFKCPLVPFYRDNNGDVYPIAEEKFNLDFIDEDLFREELYAFSDEGKKFGSCEKKIQGGIQDDTIFATTWALYGLMELASGRAIRNLSKDGAKGFFIPYIEGESYTETGGRRRP